MSTTLTGESEIESKPAVGARPPSVIDLRKVGLFQAIVFSLCLIALVIDGLDLQLLAFAAPPILDEWGISKASLGPAMAAALVGMAIGNGLGGWLADRFGRRPVLIASVAIFGAATLAISVAEGVTTLIVLRTICGLGFGAAVPSVMSLVVEWMPSRLHSPAVGLLSVSTPLGGILGAGVASWLISEWGWRACFVASGAVTLALAALLYFLIPESPAYLLKRRRRDKLKALLTRALGPVTQEEADSLRAAERQAGAPKDTPKDNVFAAGNRRINIGFSLSLFANSFAGYGFISWTPVILAGAGMSLAAAIQGSFFFNLCSVVGAFGGAMLMNRLGSRPTMFGALCLSGLAIAGLMLALPGYSDAPVARRTVMLLVSLAGLGVGGLQGCNYALSAMSYPAAYRSSGIGLVAAAGRVGGIVAVLVGGVLLSLEAHTTLAFFGAVGGMLLVALAGVLIIDSHRAPIGPLIGGKGAARL